MKQDWKQSGSNSRVFQPKIFIQFRVRDNMESINRKFNYEALIRRVKLYPAVFDSKHEMHKNRAYVNELWRQIAESLHCTGILITPI